MSLSSLLRMVSVGIILVLLIVEGYLKFYEKKINQAVEQGRPMKKPMVPPFKVANAMRVLLVVAALLPLIPDFAASMNSVRDLERSVEQQAAEDEMNVEFVASKHNAAALYYTENGSDHTFALYENQGIFFNEFVFIHGGNATSIDESLRMFRMENTGEMVLFSMNRPGVAKIVSHSGETYLLDPESPFVLILPSGGADFYDKDGTLLDLEEDWWYEVTVKE